MKLIKSDIDKICVREYHKGLCKSTIEDFINSDLDCVEIMDYPCKNAMSCYKMFYGYVRRLGYTNVKVVIRADKVYLVKTD